MKQQKKYTWDQIIQVGAILVDSDFNEIDRFEERCRLKSGVIRNQEL